MTGNLNVDNNKIVGLATTSNTDAATKKYVDDNAGGSLNLSDYLEKDGTVAMTGNLNLNNHKIVNLSNPTQDNDAVTKVYVDKLVHLLQFNQVIIRISLLISCQEGLNGLMK